MIERKVRIDPTPEELAFVFCNMGGDEQAKFFSHIADLVIEWDAPFCFQLQFIIDNQGLTTGGKRIMEQIGEYGKET